MTSSPQLGPGSARSSWRLAIGRLGTEATVRRIRTALTFAAVVALLVPLPGVQAAPPGLPSVFYGTVDTGDEIPPGALVLASIGSVGCGQALVKHDPALGTVYILDVRADDPDTIQVEGGVVGDDVAFTVWLPDRRTYPMIQSETWQGGVAAELNLSSTCSVVLPLIVRGR
jgi:hypothetical protein